MVRPKGVWSVASFEMSWFSDLTDKAGALLNKVDQVAATSLQDAGISSPARETGVPVNSSTSNEPAELPSYWDSQKRRGETVAQVLVGSATGSPLITPTSRHSKPVSCHSGQRHTRLPGPSHSQLGSANYPINSSSSTTKQPLSEDSLFEFLNSPKSSRSRGSRSNSRLSAIMTPDDSEAEMPRPHSMPMLVQSSPKKEAGCDEDKSKRSKSVKPDEEEGSGVKLEEVATGGTEEKDKEKEKEPAQVVEEMDFDRVDGLTVENLPPEPESESEVCVDKEVQENSSAAAVEVERLKQTVSNLQLENKLMKREMISLNDEQGRFIVRLNEASQVADHYQSEIHALGEQALRSDQVIRQLRSQGEDLQTAVDVRDSQLQVLRAQLAMADQAVEENKEQLVLARKEQER